jgi:hypothetical protein
MTSGGVHDVTSWVGDMGIADRTACPPPRRRPFLVRGLENTLIKLLLSTEFFDESNRKKIGIGAILG